MQKIQKQQPSTKCKKYKKHKGKCKKFKNQPTTEKISKQKATKCKKFKNNNLQQNAKNTKKHKGKCKKIKNQPSTEKTSKQKATKCKKFKNNNLQQNAKNTKNTRENAKNSKFITSKPSWGPLNKPETLYEYKPIQANTKWPCRCFQMEAGQVSVLRSTRVRRSLKGPRTLRRFPRSFLKVLGLPFCKAPWVPSPLATVIRLRA